MTFTDGQSTWSVVWPRGWETTAEQDREDPSRVQAKGPLSKGVQGVGWGKRKIHGVVVWPEMVLGWIGENPDIFEETVIDEKRAMIYEYQDSQNRFIGCAVERGDCLIYVAIGCPRTAFAGCRETLKKVIHSLKCAR